MILDTYHQMSAASSANQFSLQYKAPTNPLRRVQAGQARGAGPEVQDLLQAPNPRRRPVESPDRMIVVSSRTS
jgi:hypothetical protein